MIDEAALLARCTFPAPGTAVVCGLSGGADSTAMTALAIDAGCAVEAVHVHHGLRPEADAEAEIAGGIAATLGVPFRVATVAVDDGPNLEARARAARRRALGPDALTGHTADDQAETLLLALVRGAGASGLSAIQPGWRHPILSLRRRETEALCAARSLCVVDDPSNRDPRFRRNRVRHELLPLLDEIAERDVTPLLARTAALLRRDDLLLEEMAAAIDPTDASALAAAPTPLATRALRSWLDDEGYPPDAATVERVLRVAHGRAAACEISGGRRIERHGDQLRLCPPPHGTD
jgi:tRNA(Ile)-lysidine synthase